MSKSLPFSIQTLRWAAVAAALSCGAGAAAAQTLSELVNLGRSYDATYLAAKDQVNASVARAEQAKAGLLPTVGASGSLSYTDIDRNDVVKRRALGLSAVQPLFRKANTVGYDQAQLGVDVAQAQLKVAEQDLMVRLSQAYFDVLAARAQLVTVEASKKAVKEQLERAKRNFEVGTATITDTREAQAQYDRIIAAEIAAQNDAKVKQLALDQMVGQDNVEPHDLRADVALPSVTPKDVNHWVEQALANNGQVQMAQIALKSAGLSIDKAKAGHLPTVDLSYTYSNPRVVGYRCAPGATTVCSSQALALSVNVPLFAGYAIQNQVKEAVALESKARADLTNAQRSVSQITRSAYYGVLSGQSQISALQAAVASSQSALDANKTGYEVGVRINADVLNSQSQLFQTQVDLTKARYNVVLGAIKLRQAVGVLSQADLGDIPLQ
jgi:outer membrane protein